MTRVATPPFLGRQRELLVLRARLDEARAGRGSLVRVTGDAGIGKTALARALADEAMAQGVPVLWGACYEGEGHPPFGPWIEMLEARVRAIGGDRFRQEIGSDASPLWRLVPTLPGGPERETEAGGPRPDDERVWLASAMIHWLLTIAEAGPVVLVLDDLHWADRDSLWLFRQVARVVARAPLLVLAVYRDPDPDRAPTGPLRDTLGSIAREVEAAQLALTGLDQEQVAAYLAAAAGTTIASGLVHRLSATTGGNPFYLRELWRHLVEEGMLVEHAGQWATYAPLAAVTIPATVRQVIDRRLGRLTPPTAALLTLACVFTSGVTFAVLQAQTDWADEALLAGLDEALAAGLLRVSAEGPPAVYEFAHAIARQAIAAGLNPDRRARLHRRAALALEHIAGDQVAAHAADLASHYHLSRALPGAKRGLAFALMAAEAARAGAAHERAVTCLRQARDLVAGHPAAERAPVLQRLAIAEAEALWLEAARQTADEAVALLLDLAPDEPGRRAVADFLATMARTLKEGGAAPALWEPLVERGLALTSARPDLAWARLMLVRDRRTPLVIGEITVEHWRPIDPVALAIARDSGDEDDYAATLEPFDWRTPAETTAILALARQWQRPAAVTRALDVAARDLLYRQGDPRAAMVPLEAVLATSARLGAIPWQVEALVQLSLCQTLLGEREQAVATRRRGHDLAARLGWAHRLRFGDTALGSIHAYFYDGDWAALAAAAAQSLALAATGARSIGLPSAAFAVYNHGRSGDLATMRRLLAALAQVHAHLPPTAYLYAATVHQAGAAIWEAELVEFADHYRRLALDVLAQAGGDGPMLGNALTVARMAALLVDREMASASFAQARVVLDAAGYRPLRAIVDYDEALALVRLGQAGAPWAGHCLTAARDQFAALGMAGWEERAQALLARLAASPVSSRPTPAAERRPGGLTRREVEVLALLAGGRTNREIAAELFLSVPTVQRHIANIYGKIGAHGRADATVYALRQGLLPPGAS